MTLLQTLTLYLTTTTITSAVVLYAFLLITGDDE